MQPYNPCKGPYIIEPYDALEGTQPYNTLEGPCVGSLAPLKTAQP